MQIYLVLKINDGDPYQVQTEVISAHSYIENAEREAARIEKETDYRHDVISLDVDGAGEDDQLPHRRQT